MAAIHDLLAQVQDEVLRARLEQEINRLSKTKKFGLVFEEHLPECTPLYDIPVKRGSTVAKKTGAVSEMYEVNFIKDGVATCYHKVTAEKEEIPVEELVCVAQFGEPIYPYLKPIDSICNAPDSDLWHTLIEADNYHALQLLEYLYAGKVDCIYIDPPYNTGAKDWKYNNDYVDGSDAYRHSKWLSMMQKRLRLAKTLMNHHDSVLIVTIDEKEYLHLGCLLEEMFQDCNIQMISSAISRKGAARTNEFTRVNEFIYFVMMGNCAIEPLDDAEYALEGEQIHWQSFRRSSAANIRKSRPFQFYPIYVNKQSGRIEKIGDPIAHEVDRFSVEEIPGCDAVFPVRDDGTEMLWGVTPEECRSRAEKGYIKASKRTPNKPQLWVVQYLMGGTIKDIDAGKINITGYAEDGSVIAENLETRKIMPRTQWNYNTHDSRDYGTKILKNVIGDLRFDFPKSLYAVKDTINYFLVNKKDALAVDFFAGSGTTLHAINLLNSEDGGHRRCIMVTNNEVSESEAKLLTSKGKTPADKEWEELGIARYVTWPRTICSIKGTDVNGKKIAGNYLGSNAAMSDGFKANAVFFKLGFLDKTAVALGRQLTELFPVLWMKAGAHGSCPQLEDDKAHMMVLPENQFAILMDEKRFAEFDAEVQKHPEIQTIYIVTDSEAGYREMISGYAGKDTFQLYRDYLDNFRINTGR